MKKVKLTLNRVMELQNALRELGNMKFPMKAAYTIARLQAKIESEAKLVTDQRDKLIREKGEEDKATGAFSIHPNTPEFHEFNRQYGELLKEEVEIEVMMIDPDQLGDTEIEPRLLMAVDEFIGPITVHGTDAVPVGLPPLFDPSTMNP